MQTRGFSPEEWRWLRRAAGNSNTPAAHFGFLAALTVPAVAFGTYGTLHGDAIALAVVASGLVVLAYWYGIGGMLSGRLVRTIATKLLEVRYAADAMSSDDMHQHGTSMTPERDAGGMRAYAFSSEEWRWLHLIAGDANTIGAHLGLLAMLTGPAIVLGVYGVLHGDAVRLAFVVACLLVPVSWYAIGGMRSGRIARTIATKLLSARHAPDATLPE